jgi:hypothetical protein
MQFIVMVTDYPAYLFVFGNCPDVIKKIPTFFGEISEVHALKNVAEKNDFSKRKAFQGLESLFSLAYR